MRTKVKRARKVEDNEQIRIAVVRKGKINIQKEKKTQKKDLLEQLATQRLRITIEKENGENPRKKHYYERQK